MNLGLEQLVQSAPSKISISPYSGIQQIKLGSDRESIRKALGDYKEFKKTKASANSTDDFKWVHVYYNKSNKCVAFEIFFEKSSKETKLEVKLDGIDLVSTNFDDVVKHIQEKDSECKVTKSEITSTKFGVIIGKDSVVVFAKEYIQKSSSEVLQSLETLLGKEPEMNFTVSMSIANQTQKVPVTIDFNGAYDPASLGSAIINCIANLDKSYQDIIRMSDAWLKEYVEKEGGPEEAPLDNTTPIDSTKEFNITHIYIYPKQFTNSHYFTNKKYSYDTIIWFHNWNENGRGMDAYFLKGKLIAVEMTP